MLSPALVAENARTPKDEIFHETALPLGPAVSRKATGRKDRAIDAILVVVGFTLADAQTFWKEARSKLSDPS
jgi:hypothetical protein